MKKTCFVFKTTLLLLMFALVLSSCLSSENSKSTACIEGETLEAINVCTTVSDIENTEAYTYLIISPTTPYTAENLPITETTVTEPPTENYSEFYYETYFNAWIYTPYGSVPVYDSTDTNSNIIVTLYNKDVVNVIGNVSDWYIVAIDGDTVGYIKKVNDNVPLMKICSFEKSSNIDPLNLVLIGTATTSSSSEDSNRATNLRISSEAASIILKNGETFSMNQTTGPRSAASGYKEASVFVNGQVSEGLGGGVCQTTTTIHMATQNAISSGYDLEIIEANKHSRPVGYVDSRDQEAMVNWGSSDFRFKNNTGADIAIIVTSENQTVTAEIFLVL